MALTQTQIDKAKPDPKPRTLWDANGLYLEISPAGGKWWRLKYCIDGKEERLSLGTFPDVSLKMARKRRDDARELLADGVDPSAHRGAERKQVAMQAANSFEAIAREWHAKQLNAWTERHAGAGRRFGSRRVVTTKLRRRLTPRRPARCISRGTRLRPTRVPSSRNSAWMFGLP